MIAKAKAISHGREALNYALRESKIGKFITSNLVESNNPDEILKEFEMVQQYNSRCKNKFIRIEIGIAPQDENKLSTKDLEIICKTFAKVMKFEDYQWIACTHKDTDNLHIHMIANRIGIDGNVYQTDFISNKAAKTAELISHKMGLTIANEVRKNKESLNQNISPERILIKKRLQDLAYAELRTRHTNSKDFFSALKKQRIEVDFARNKKNDIYGIRFKYEGETFKASDIGKEFGYHSLMNHFHEAVGGKIPKTAYTPKTQKRPSSDKEHETSSSLSPLFSLPDINPNPTNEEEAEYLRQLKRKKKRKGLRW